MRYLAIKIYNYWFYLKIFAHFIYWYNELQTTKKIFKMAAIWPKTVP